MLLMDGRITEYLTVRDAAQYVGVSAQTLRRSRVHVSGSMGRYRGGRRAGRSSCSHGGARSASQLPMAALRYVDAVEELAGVPVTNVSVGPERNQVIARRAHPAGARVVA